MGDNINLVDELGNTLSVPVEQAGTLIKERKYRVESADASAGRLAKQARTETYGGIGGKVVGGGAAVLRGVTGGGSDALISALGGGEDLRALREENPTISTIGEIAGTLSPTGIGGVAARVGEKAAGAFRGAGALSKVAKAASGAGAEGAVLGAGQGVSELALSEDPLTLERAASVIGSNMALGGVVGAGAGGLGKGVELSLKRAKTALDIAASTSASAAGGASTHVDDLVQYRSAVKDANPWAAISEGEEAALLNNTNKRLRNALNDPQGLAERPGTLLKPLREQEQAFERALANREAIGARLESANTKIAKDLGEELATLPSAANEVTLTGKSAQRYGSFADVKVGKVDKIPTVTIAREEAHGFMSALQEGRVSGQGQEALDKLAGLADANRQLQAKIVAATAKPAAAASGGISEAIGASALGHVVGAAAGVPFLGQAVLAGKAATGIIKKLGANTAAVAERASAGVSAFLDVGGKVGSKARAAAPVLATKVLSSARYAPGPAKAPKDTGSPTLAKAYLARAEEIRSQMAPAPDGSLQMHQGAREQMAERLAPIRAVQPVLADRIETLKAKGLAYLASKLPTRPDLAPMQMGPDKWQPSDMEMRAFARHAAAVNDPHSIVERLVDGSITPEDAEAMKAVYPEMHADITRQIIEQLPTLQKQLPYARRIALSIFSGVAVDPAMDPQIFSVLQGQFANEEGTEGGTQAPVAQPQFGSVSKPKPTPAQERAS